MVVVTSVFAGPRETLRGEGDAAAQPGGILLQSEAPQERPGGGQAGDQGKEAAGQRLRQVHGYRSGLTSREVHRHLQQSDRQSDEPRRQGLQVSW